VANGIQAPVVLESLGRQLNTPMVPTLLEHIGDAIYIIVLAKLILLLVKLDILYHLVMSFILTRFLPFARPHAYR
jgi:hypothetical protein